MAKTSSFPLKAATSSPTISRPRTMSTVGKASTSNRVDAASFGMKWNLKIVMEYIRIVKHTLVQSERKSEEMGIKRESEGTGSWRENVCLFPSTRAQHSLCTINFPTRKPAGLVTPSCFECLQWLNTYWSQGSLEFSTSSAPWMVGSPIHNRKKPEPNFQAWVCFSRHCRQWLVIGKGDRHTLLIITHTATTLCKQLRCRSS